MNYLRLLITIHFDAKNDESNEHFKIKQMIVIKISSMKYYHG